MLSVAVTTYVIVFLAAFGETLPILGFLVPGHVLVLAAGAAAATGSADVGIVALVASLGAILGDAASYFLARRAGAPFLARFEGRFGMTRERLDKARATVHRNPFVAIVVGRFNSITRAIAPFAAGLAEFPLGRFMTYNVMGGVAWGASAAFLGYAFGASFHAVQQVLGRMLAAVLLVILLIVVGAFLLRRVHVSITRREAAWLVTGLLALGCFFVISESAPESEGLAAYDAPIALALQAATHGYLFELLDTVSEWGATLPVIAAIVVVCALLIWDGKRAEALRVASLSLLGYAAFTFVKLLIARPRPIDSTDAGYSFPSGHTTMAALLGCLVAWHVTQKYEHRAVTIVMLTLAGTWTGLMGVSRVALGTHYASDVAAGALLGVSIASLGLAGPTVAPKLGQRAGAVLEKLSDWLKAQAASRLRER